jgi:hypothetical protein
MGKQDQVQHHGRNSRQPGNPPSDHFSLKPQSDKLLGRTTRGPSGSRPGWRGQLGCRPVTEMRMIDLSARKAKVDLGRSCGGCGGEAGQE